MPLIHEPKILPGTAKSFLIDNSSPGKNDSWLEIDGGLNKYSVKSYTVIDETNKDQYSFWKGALGATLLGGLGVLLV